MQKKKIILKLEYDPRQCAHIPRKIGRNHSQNLLGQNNLVKAHTPYSSGQKKKTSQSKDKCLSI